MDKCGEPTQSQTNSIAIRGQLHIDFDFTFCRKPGFFARLSGAALHVIEEWSFTPVKRKSAGDDWRSAGGQQGLSAAGQLLPSLPLSERADRSVMNDEIVSGIYTGKFEVYDEGDYFLTLWMGTCDSSSVIVGAPGYNEDRIVSVAYDPAVLSPKVDPWGSLPNMRPLTPQGMAQIDADTSIAAILKITDFNNTQHITSTLNNHPGIKTSMLNDTVWSLFQNPANPKRSLLDQIPIPNPAHSEAQDDKSFDLPPRKMRRLLTKGVSEFIPPEGELVGKVDKAVFSVTGAGGAGTGGSGAPPPRWVGTSKPDQALAIRWLAQATPAACTYRQSVLVSPSDCSRAYGLDRFSR